MSDLFSHPILNPPGPNSHTTAEQWESLSSEDRERIRRAVGGQAVTIPILPPEESQRMGYPVTSALEARVEAAGKEARWASVIGDENSRVLWGQFQAYRDSLELVRAAHRAYGGD